MSWAFDQPCQKCGHTRHEHDPHTVRHTYVTPAIPIEDIWTDHEKLAPPTWNITTNGSRGPAHRALDRHCERELRGGYDSPLPSPAERKRIREASGLTQQDLADELADRLTERRNVDRTLISRWEKPAGYVNGKRLEGREPSWRMREEYSKLLRHIERRLQERT